MPRQYLEIISQLKLISQHFPDPHSESQMTECKGASGWSGRLEQQGELGQRPRPRAFSQSAVQTLEQKEKERDPEKVGGF